MFRFIKTTTLGGLLFLLPIIVLIALLTQAHQLISKLSAPIMAKLPMQEIILGVSVENVLGIAFLDLLTIALLVLICFVAGLLAKTSLAARLATSLETKYLSKIPPYDDAKTKLSARLRFEKKNNKTSTELLPILVCFDDRWQIAFEVERGPSNSVVVFLPGAPDPWAGSICIINGDRIKTFKSTPIETLNILKELGKGTSAQLQHQLHHR
jgi:uncharacterized membrane protein